MAYGYGVQKKETPSEASLIIGYQNNRCIMKFIKNINFQLDTDLMIYSDPLL